MAKIVDYVIFRISVFEFRIFHFVFIIAFRYYIFECYLAHTNKDS
ncbi:hypothetical protein BH11BAC1_BH11BAC1_09620 [soil metagenome]